MAAPRVEQRKRPYLSALALLLVLLAAQTVSSAGTAYGVPVPRGYRVVQRHHVASGVWHLALRRRSPDELVHVARIERESSSRLRVVLSNNRVAGPTPRTERTTSMCRRTKCLIAVNGSFFTKAGLPVGGVFQGGRPARSPIDTRPHLSIAGDGSRRLGKLTMTTTLTTFHPRVPGLLFGAPSSEPRSTVVNGLNIPRPADQIILYTPRFGPRTATRGGVELVARLAAPSAGIKSGVPATVELLSKKSGGSGIPSDGVVLSGDGKGAAALNTLWQDVVAGRAERSASIQVTTTPNAIEALAGKPILVRDGKRVVSSGSQRNARTMIGWNARGDLLLVTVDGKQRGRSVGLSVVEAAKLMQMLGAVDAMNLDGGGSTTFVMRGRLINRPSTSSHRERAVAVAVAIVRRS